MMSLVQGGRVERKERGGQEEGGYNKKKQCGLEVKNNTKYEIIYPIDLKELYTFSCED